MEEKEENKHGHGNGCCCNRGSAFSHPKLGGSVVMVLILLSGFLFLQMVSEIKAYKYIGGGVPVSNTITVSGAGEVFAVADIATFSFTVTEEADSTEAAQKAVTDKMTQAIKILDDYDVAERDRKTTNYSVYPRYEYKREKLGVPGGTRELAGYESSHNMTVKVRDTDKVGEIVAAIGDLASNIGGVQLIIDDEEELQADARELAIENAKVKAKVLARDLEVDLVRVVSFSEGGYQPIYRSFAESSDMVMAMDGGAVAPEIELGENRIVSNVNVTYEIR